MLNKKVKYLHKVVEQTRLIYSNKNLNNEQKSTEEEHKENF